MAATETDKEEIRDPEAEDPNNQPGPDNPVALTRFGREIRERRLFEKFVAQDVRILTEEEAIAEAERQTSKKFSQPLFSHQK